MNRSDRKRKQPDSIYRLQEADYQKMKSRRLVRTAAATHVTPVVATDDKNLKCQPPQGNVSGISDEEFSSKLCRHSGSGFNHKSNLSTTRRSSHSYRCRRVKQQQTKPWQPSGNTKLGIMAKTFVDFLKVRLAVLPHQN
jgi:hypothetical protein